MHQTNHIAGVVGGQIFHGQEEGEGGGGEERSGRGGTDGGRVHKQKLLSGG